MHIHYCNKTVFFNSVRSFMANSVYQIPQNFSNGAVNSYCKWQQSGIIKFSFIIVTRKGMFVVYPFVFITKIGQFCDLESCLVTKQSRLNRIYLVLLHLPQTSCSVAWTFIFQQIPNKCNVAGNERRMNQQNRDALSLNQNYWQVLNHLLH